jgi:hypothetical protein
MSTAGKLSKGEMKRLQVLQGRKDVNREKRNSDRVSRIESEGLAAVQKDELDRNRASQSRITAMHKADPAARSNDLQRSLELGQNRLKAGGNKKVRGISKTHGQQDVPCLFHGHAHTGHSDLGSQICPTICLLESSS